MTGVRKIPSHARVPPIIYFGVTLLTGAATSAWPLAAPAQQPGVKFLRSTTSADSGHLGAAFRQGLRKAGLVEGQDCAIEYRWAEN